MRMHFAWIVAFLATGWAAPAAPADRYPEPRFDAAARTAGLHAAQASERAPGPGVVAGGETVVSAVGGRPAPAGKLTEVTSVGDRALARMGSDDATAESATGGAPSAALALLCGLVFIAYVARRRMS